MARSSRFRRSFGRRARTIVRYVKTRSRRPRSFFQKNQKMLLIAGVLGGIAWFNKDKIKEMIAK